MIVTLNDLTFIKFSCRHFGQYRGNLLISVSFLIFNLVLLPHTGHKIHLFSIFILPHFRLRISIKRSIYFDIALYKICRNIYIKQNAVNTSLISVQFNHSVFVGLLNGEIPPHLIIFAWFINLFGILFRMVFCIVSG